MSAPRWTRWNGRKGDPVLGIVMIVKNEAENLPHLFETIADLADEVVVVDTGSTDATVSVCEAWGVRVVHEPWRDDFSYSRNCSIAAATAPYLLWLDGDDRLPPEAQERLCWLRDTVLPRSPRQAYVLEVQSVNAAGEAMNALLQARLFPRLPGVEFRHAIHEEVASSLIDVGVEITRFDVTIEHLGYRDPVVNSKKVERNEALLRRALEKNPNDFHARIHMAQTLSSQGKVAEAEREISAVIAQAPEARVNDRFLAELHTLRARHRRRLANRLGAIYDLERAAELWPEWAIPYVSLAELRFGENDAAACRKMVARARAASFESSILGFPVRQAQRNLEVCAGQLHLRSGEPEQGIACLLRALEITPKALRLRMKVGQELLDAGRFEEALRVLEPAGQDEGNESSAVEISAAIALARFMTGDEAGAGACLAPLLDVFAEPLGGVDEAGPLELAEALLNTGHKVAAMNLIALFKHTALAAR